MRKHFYSRPYENCVKKLLLVSVKKEKLFERSEFFSFRKAAIILANFQEVLIFAYLHQGKEEEESKKHKLSNVKALKAYM